jgi:hypothetical protein
VVVGVQIQPQQPKDPNNGLASIEDVLLAYPDEVVVAVVTYRVAKVVDDLTKQVRYPVLRMVSIEPVGGDLEAQGLGLREAAHKARTGEELELDFSGVVPEGEAEPTGLRLVPDEEEEVDA